MNRLVPFVHVEDVARSVNFYRQLGFAVESVDEYKGRPVWVADSSRSRHQPGPRRADEN
jgi:predicted lactoylglutathione lyase